MYFWVILGSLMVGLMTASLPVRDDYQEVKGVVTAESFANWIVTHHAIAMKYVRAYSPPDNGAADVTYTNTDIGAEADFASYGPDAASYDSLRTTFGVTVKSEIFCFDKTAGNTSTRVTCTNDGSTMNVLITHVPVPPQWINTRAYVNGVKVAFNLRETQVAYELRRAIAKLTDYSVSVGVTVKTAASALGVDCIDSDRDGICPEAAETAADEDGDGTPFEPEEPALRYYGIEGSTMGIQSYSRGVQVYIPPGAQASVGYNSMAYITILSGAEDGLTL